jgi:hypothetical protein
MNARIVAAVLLVLTFSGVTAFAQCSTPRDFDEWINCRVEQIASARINQRGNTQQTESPALSSNSTSLVDQSSAPDLVGLALNLGGLTSKSNDPNTSASSVTTSLYALYAAALKHDPLDPAFYLRNRDWRRVSFTLGQEFPDESGATGSQRATVIGAKLLLWDRRDASDSQNRERIKAVGQQLRNSTPNFLRIAHLVQDYMYEQLAPSLSLPLPATTQSLIDFVNTFLERDHIVATLGLLKDEQMSTIDKIIGDRIDPEVKLTDDTRKLVEEIRRAPQLSVAFQSKIAKDEGANEYRFEAILDRGVYRRLNLTLNGTFQYRDSKTIGLDQRGGRLAEEFRFQLTPESKLSGRQPWILSVAGEEKWLTKTSPTYTVQAKITVSIINGVDLPISVSWANRAELIKEADIKGRFGFTFDVAKLMKAFK